MKRHVFVPYGQHTVVCPFCEKEINLELYHEDINDFYMQTCEHLDREDFATPSCGGDDIWFRQG